MKIKTKRYNFAWYSNPLYHGENCVGIHAIQNFMKRGILKMARERMVTRTVEVKQVNVLTLNVETMKAEKMIVPITGKPDDKKLEKLVKAAVETESVKFVQILGIETSEVLYGMTEADFIRLAKVLPPRSGATESEDEG